VPTSVNLNYPIHVIHYQLYCTVCICVFYEQTNERQCRLLVHLLSSVHLTCLQLCTLQRFREVYETQLRRGPPSKKAQYDYAWCLVRSVHKTDMLHGIEMLIGSSDIISRM